MRLARTAAMAYSLPASLCLPCTQQPVSLPEKLVPVRVCQTEVQFREWRFGNGGSGMEAMGMGMKVSVWKWRMRALEWKACNRMSFPHLQAIICI